MRVLLHLFGQIRDVHHLTRRHLGRTYIEEYGTRCYIRIGNNHFGFRNFGHRLVLCSHQCILQLLVGSSHLCKLCLHGSQLYLRNQLRHRATESTGGETVCQPYRCTQHAIISMIAANFAIELIFNAHCAQLQVNIYRIGNTEAIDDTRVYRQSFAVRLCVVVSEASTYIRNDFIHTVLVVSSNQRIQIEHHITMKVHILKALLERTVFTLSALYIIGKRIHRETFCLKTAILQTQSETRSKPFADRDVHRRTDALAEVAQLLVVISIHHRCTASDRKEPVAPKWICDYLVLVLYLNNVDLFHNDRFLLRHSSRRYAGQCQQH